MEENKELFENAPIEVGDTVRTKDGELVVTGFKYHLRALFVVCGDRTIRGYNILGVTKKEK